MGATLQALSELQDIELQIVDIRRQLARKDRLVAQQEARLKTLQQALDTERQDIKRAQMEIDALDLDLKGRTANVSKLREHLNSVKTNKDYAAVLSQLNNEKADATRVETRALELMAALETRRGNLTERERELETEAARLADLKNQSDQARRSFSDRLTTLQAQRDAAAARSDKKAVDTFDRLSERYEGEAMARVERTHPRRDEFMCTGCHMALSAEVANGLMVRDEVVTCKNCGRILYIDKAR